MSVGSKPIVHEGDRVRDPMDGRIRTVTRVCESGQVFMADGGVMGIDECSEVYLPSETVPEFEPVYTATPGTAGEAYQRFRLNPTPENQVAWEAAQDEEVA